MGITKGLAIIDSAGVDFNRGNARALVWSVVLEIDRMLHSQGQRVGSSTSGQCEAEWIMEVLARDETIEMAPSATPF